MSSNQNTYKITLYKPHDNVRIYSHSIVKNCPQFVPVCPIYTQPQKLQRIHGVKFGSRFSGRSRVLWWVTVDHGKLRTTANGNMDTICQRWGRQRSSALLASTMAPRSSTHAAPSEALSSQCPLPQKRSPASRSSPKLSFRV